LKALIDIIDLHKSFNSQKVLRGVNLKIEGGKINVIIGRSGEGKTVLLKHIIGLLKPDKGRILVEGEDITSMGLGNINRVRRKFGMLFQNGALFDSLNVFENVAFPLREHTKLSESEIKEIVRQKLKEVGLEGIEDKMPAELSGGMRKRVGLARALTLNPQIILFDEPTSGLDPIMAEHINELIIETHRRSKNTFLVITHDIASSFKIAHKMAMLHEGVIIEEGSPEDFKNSPNPVVQQFINGLIEGPIKVI